MGFGLNVMGAAAGYKAYKDQQRQDEQDARQKADDAARASDQAYQEELRSRQRYDWSETDRIRNDKKRYGAQYDAQYGQPPAGTGTDADATTAGSAAAPAAPAASPAAPAAAGPGIAAGMADPGSPVADPGAAITPAPLKAATSQAAPLDASLDGAPPQRAVAQSGIAPAPAPAPPVPVDAALAGAPGQPAPLDPGTAPAAPPSMPGAAAAAASQPASVPAQAGTATAALQQPAGIPQPRQFASVLGRYNYVLDAQAKAGDVDPQTYLQTKELFAKMQSEGMIQGLAAFARGDFAGGVNLNNSMGDNKISIVPNSIRQTTTTLPGGQTVPTYQLRVKNSDGSYTDIDTAQSQYQMLGMKDKLDLMDKAAEHANTAKYQTGMVSVAERHAAAAEQQANTMEGYRKDQAKNAADANLVRLLTARGGNAAKLDDKAIKEALDLNEHLYSYIGEDGKDVAVAPAKALYGNMMLRLHDPDKAYQVMTGLRDEAVKDATDAKTGVMDRALFLKSFTARVAASDAAMRQGTGPAAPAAPAGVAPGTAPGTAAPPKGKPAAPAEPSSPPAPPAEKVWQGNDYVDNPAYAEWVSKYKKAWDAENNAFAARMAGIRL